MSCSLYPSYIQKHSLHPHHINICMVLSANTKKHMNTLTDLHILTQRHTGPGSAFLGPPCLQPWAISRATMIYLSSSLPSFPLSAPLLYPCGHLYSSTFIYCHPVSVPACSEHLSCLASCSAPFTPPLSSVPSVLSLACPFPLIMAGFVQARVQLSK